MTQQNTDLIKKLTELATVQAAPTDSDMSAQGLLWKALRTLATALLSLPQFGGKG